MSEIDQIVAMARELRNKFGEGIVDIVLFGSLARGEYSRDSDIDILVIVSDERIENEVRKTVYSFIPAVKRLISVKVLEKNEFDIMKKSDYSFIRSIIKEGISIG